MAARARQYARNVALEGRGSGLHAASGADSMPANTESDSHHGESQLAQWGGPPCPPAPGAGHRQPDNQTELTDFTGDADPQASAPLNMGSGGVSASDAGHCAAGDAVGRASVPADAGGQGRSRHHGSGAGSLPAESSGSGLRARDLAPHGCTNAALTSRQVKAYCVLSEPCQALLMKAAERLGLSARAYERIRKVARTIADLAGSDDIEVPHLAEAIQYRSGEERLRG